MGIYRTFWVSCDSCGGNSHDTNQNCSQRECVKQATSAGWKKKRIQGKEWWFCPGCNPSNCVTYKLKDGRALISVTVQRKNAKLWEVDKVTAADGVTVYRDKTGWSCGIAVSHPIKTFYEDPRRSDDERDLTVVIDEILKDVEHDLIGALRALISTDYPGSTWETWALAMHARDRAHRL